MMTDREAAHRWKSLLRPRARMNRFGEVMANEITEEDLAQLLSSPARIAKIRADLSDLGFFHRLLKEPCARRWNREEDATGHFWEGRFKSPRILDAEMLLSVSTYIELNEIHAGCAHGIDSSHWSSARIQWMRLLDAVRARLASAEGEDLDLEDVLSAVPWEPVFPVRLPSSFIQRPGENFCGQPPRLPMKSAATYLAFVDEMGRRSRADKACRIAPDAPRALEVLLNSLERPSASPRAKHAIARWRNEFVCCPLRVASQKTSTAEAAAREIAAATLSVVDPLQWSAGPSGSCYGNDAALALETLRRGRVRVSPVFRARAPSA